MLFQSTKSLLAAATALAAITLTQVSAHGSILSPTVVFLDPYNRNAPSVLVDGPAGPYTGDAVLKELANANGSKCGKTDGNAAVQPMPADGVVQLQITAAHIGPCEVWLDNEKMASAKNCVTEYPDRKIKVDFSKCKSGKCQLRWVWLATHNSPWEIFDNCVNVGSGADGGGNDNGGDVTVSPTTTPLPSAAPVPTTATPATPATSTPVTPAPEQPTTAPTTAPTTTTPTSAPQPTTSTPASDDIDGSPQSQFRGVDNSDSLNWWCQVNCERGYCPESTCVDTKKVAVTAPPAVGGGDAASVLTYRGIDNSAPLNAWCQSNCERGFCPESTCVKA